MTAELERLRRLFGDTDETKFLPTRRPGDAAQNDD